MRLHLGLPAAEPQPVTGACPWWCGQTETQVVWVGSGRIDGATADLYACGDCALRLEIWIRDHGR